VKRRYKEGDWLRIPLDAQHDAFGVIARACRSRLFGYFFALPADSTPTHDQLKALRSTDAVACSLFGGAALEDSRWNVIATSVPFDREAWPFPQFASRGAFGRTWTRRTYDPQTMQIVQTETIDEQHAAELPDARFATEHELEALLRERISGITPREPMAIYEVQPGFDPAGLHLLARGGRVQFSEMLAPNDLGVLAGFISQHPAVELRVHGFSTRAFDLRSLSAFHTLHALTLDVKRLEHPNALTLLTGLRRLRIGPLEQAVRFESVAALPSLHALEVCGERADVSAAAACPALEELTLIDAPPVDFARFSSTLRLRELTIAHTVTSLEQLQKLPALARLELRDMTITNLPDLARSGALHALTLRNVTHLRDLAALTSAPALRELEIAGMPQLEVWDFEPLTKCRNLRRVTVDIGSRTKTREVYRMLHVGRTLHEVFRH
jgi:hypothetical protein